MNHNIKINLSKVAGAFFADIKGKTATKKCICIPVENSGLFVGEKGVYLNVAAFELKEPKYEQTHLVKLSLDKSVRESMTEEERNALPILGGMSNMGIHSSEAIKTQGVVTTENADDLPF